MARRLARLAAALAVVAAGCGGGDDDQGRDQPAPSTMVAPVSSTTAPSATTAPPTSPTTKTTTATTTTTAPAGGTVVATFESAGTRFEVREVARGLDTVWAIDWDPAGALWYTERAGRLTKLGERPRTIAGVVEQGEGGLLGLEFDAQGRAHVMFTSAEDNRVVRLEPDGSQRLLVGGIAKAAVHNGGRLRFGPDGALYATTGDAGRRDLPPDPASLSGKILRIDTGTGQAAVFSRGHRNPQGLCFDPAGRLLETEHGPNGGDEVNVVAEGFDGGWPDRAGNGIRNYTPSVAPAGCAVYDAALIPAWRGSMLFGTLAGTSLRRLTFAGAGSVAAEEVLLDGRLGRLRDVAVGPDGAVYVATSNRDGRGRPRDGDDRVLRITPAG